MCILIACLLVVFGEKVAAGSGIPEIKVAWVVREREREREREGERVRVYVCEREYVCGRRLRRAAAFLKSRWRG